MDKPIDRQIQELQQAIDAQENLRATLGDDIVEQTIRALREKLAELQPSFEQERKLVSCLFCDVVGSTRLARNRDPEEVLGIIDGALREMSAAVEAFDGFIARYMGDGMLVLFGAPRALEDHAEQAIRAGLDIQSRIGGYSALVVDQYRLPDFSVRVGINSGYVVGGHVAGGKGEYTVIGDAINIASRLEAACPPGGILVGQSTFRMANAQRFFDYESRPAVTVKGINAPLAAFQILGVHEQPVSLGPTAVSRARLIGREKELAFLQDQLRAVGATSSGISAQGAVRESRVSEDESGAQAVTIIGPAGTGKSRLALEFRNWLFAEYPTARLWLGRSVSYERHTPYWLVGDMLKNALGIGETDSAQQRMEKLNTSWSAGGGSTTQQLHALATLMALAPPNNRLASLEPEARRKVMHEAFTNYCAQQAQRGLLVVVLEDMHWADKQSLDLFEHLLLTLPNASLFLLSLGRPSVRQAAPFEKLVSSPGSACYSELTLRDLAPEETMAIVEALLNSADLPAWLTKTVAERSQGNPFFAEEIVNELIETGLLMPVNGSWQVTGEPDTLQVPDTVQGVLAARIDRLEPALKHTIQHAAMIGRSFWQLLLADLLGEEVTGQLALLSELEFIHRFGRAAFLDDWEWVFRHVLVQEVAYDSVLKEARRPVHTQIARWLEREAADRIAELAPTLARHYSEGQVWAKAIHYLATAGDRSRDLFATSEAMLFYDQALALADAHLEEGTEAERLDLLEKRGAVRGLTGDFEGAIADLELVLSAARDSGDRSSEQAILTGQGLVYRRADDYENATSRLSMALDAARESGDQHRLADVLYHLGSVIWSRGENLEATGYHQQALDICRREGLEDLVAVQATHGQAEVHFVAGQIHKAVELFTESLALARRIGDRSYETENLQMIAMLNGGLLGTANYEVCLALGEEALKISRDAHLDWHTSANLGTVAEGYAGRGDYRAAIEYCKEAQKISLSIGATRFLSLDIYEEGEINLHLNRPGQAESLFRRALQLSREANTYLWLPRVQAGLAIARIRQGDHQVGPLLEEALTTARQKGQGVYITHCYAGLAELSLAIGAHLEAQQYAEEMLTLAKQSGQREKQTIAHRLRGEARMAGGSRSATMLALVEEDLRQAHQLAEAVDAPYLLSETHGSLARFFQLQGDQDQAKIHTTARRAIVQQAIDNLRDDELSRGLRL